jgi:hypothetical protein
VRLAQAELVELERRAPGARPSACSAATDDGSARAAQEVGDVAVLLGEARSRVDEKDDDVGLGDRLARLFRHLVQDPVFRDGLESAGVHGEERAVARAAAAVMAIARQTGEIGDERRAASRQSIEERRLADVRASDDHECRQHGGRFGNSRAAKTAVSRFAAWGGVNAALGR